MSEKALRVVATGDMFITRRIAEDGYEGFEELSDCIKEHDVKFSNLEMTFHNQEGQITHTVNAFNDMADIVRLYSKKPEMAEQRLENLLSEVLYEDSDSVQNDNRSYDTMSTSESGCLQI